MSDSLRLLQSIEGLRDEKIAQESRENLRELLVSPTHRQILETLARSMGDDVDSLAQNLVAYGVERLVEILPELAGSANDRAALQDRIVRELGWGAYLRFKPYLDQKTINSLATHAEVFVSDTEVLITEWDYRMKRLTLRCPHYQNELYGFPQRTEVTLASDGEGQLWRGTHIQPVYMELLGDSFAGALIKGSVINIDGTYFYKIDRGGDKDCYHYYANTVETLNVETLDRNLIDLINLPAGVKEIEFKPRARLAARYNSYTGMWRVGAHKVGVYACHPLILEH